MSLKPFDSSRKPRFIPRFIFIIYSSVLLSVKISFSLSSSSSSSLIFFFLFFLCQLSFWGLMFLFFFVFFCQISFEAWFLYNNVFFSSPLSFNRNLLKVISSERKSPLSTIRRRLPAQWPSWSTVAERGLYTSAPMSQILSKQRKGEESICTASHQWLGGGEGGQFSHSITVRQCPSMRLSF